MDKLKKIVKVIKKANSIAIFTHISQDFDALGSSISLCLALKKIDKTTDVYIKEDLLDDQKMLYKNINIRNDLCDAKEYDLFIATDTPTLKRLGEYAYIFEENSNTMVIDHHYTEKFMAKYNYIKESESSCSEIIFEILKALKVVIDKQISTFLYAGISSDCGSFKNSNTTAKTFQAAAELLNLGADNIKVNDILYESVSQKDIELERYLLNNYKIKGDVAYITVDLKTLKTMNATKNDCDGFSRKLLTILGVNRSFSLIEKSKCLYSASFRSCSTNDVRKAALKLGGGGHVCAAGATFEAKTMAEAKKLVFDALNWLEIIWV